MISNTRKFSSGILAAALAMTAWIAPAQAPDLENMDIVEKSAPDGPVATVGGASIDREIFFNFYRAERQRHTVQRGEELSDGLRVQLAMWCLANLIEEELLYQDAKMRNLTTNDARVQTAWEEQIKQAGAMFKQRDGKDYSEEELIRLLGYADKDEAMADLRRSILIELDRMQVIRESEYEVPEEEIKAFYEANTSDFVREKGYHFRRVFVDAPGEDPKLRAEGKTRIDNAMTQIMSGKRFEAVAGELSDGPDKKNGGDVGTVGVRDLPPFYVEALESMQPGDISSILETDHGFHIVQLVETKQGGQVPLEEVKDVISRRLRVEHSAEVVRDHCDELVREKIPVNILLELERNLAIAGAGSGLDLN